ncbi:MAG: FecR domain-containing protein [Bacteroidetes bacterium]|nr:FecR domain-containing protein [Bacteroidota bacterium]
MTEERLIYLFNKLFANEASITERDEFLLLISEHNNDSALHKLVSEIFENDYTPDKLDRETSNIILLSILAADKKKDTAPVKPLKFFNAPWLSYAAAIFFILSIAAVGFLSQQKPATATLITHKKIALDLPPSKEGVTLTLSDGSKVVLDSFGNGVVATQNGVKISLKDHLLKYDSKLGFSPETSYNIITTPKGRQFQIVLPDGTMVWLNAASSIKYPIAFKEKQRIVSISGEAYFDVVRDTSRPFIVKMNEVTSVQVLGTSFNLNTYQDEEHVRATLLTGSLKVIATSANQSNNPLNSQILVLKPGQQAQISAQRQKEKGYKGEHNLIGLVENVDQDQVMAWKRGFFSFKSATLDQLMRQLSRWYDFEVVYENGAPDLHFGGELSRDLKLSELLKVLEDSKVQFRMEEGRKLIVMRR